ncbi:hypothetical protein ACQ4PT_047694 [Festuca glaucescens]
MDLLRRSSRVWAPEFLAGVDTMLTAVESDLAPARKAAQLPGPAAAVHLPVPVQGEDRRHPAVAGGAPLALLPLPLHHRQARYDILYRFIEKHGARAVAVGVDSHGLTVKDAVNNILFVLGFNAFGASPSSSPSSSSRSARPTRARSRPGSGTRSAPRWRRPAAGRVRGGGEGADAAGAVDGVRGAPDAAARAAAVRRARQDFVLRSHGGEGFAVAQGEMLCGYQPLAMRDPAVFDRPERFVADRFVGEEGEKLLSYVYWSNGPETEDPALGNKQCAAKDAVIATACMLVAELFRRYDDFQCEGTSFTKLQKRQPSCTTDGVRKRPRLLHLVGND